MERSSQKEESGEEMHNQLKPLEPDCNSMQTNLGHVKSAGSSNSILELLEDRQPRDLISDHHSLPPLEGGECEIRNNDLVVEETLAIQSGKLKGRRLLDLDALDGAGGVSDFNIRRGEDMCSWCSPVLIQSSEVRSICFSTSCSSICFSTSSSSDDGNDLNVNDDGDGSRHENSSLGEYFLLSSTSCVSAEKEVAVRDERHIQRWNGERWMVFMDCLAIVLMLSVLGIISLWSFEGFGDQQTFDNLIPT